MPQIKTFSQIISALRAKESRKKAAIVWASDEHTRQAAAIALEHGAIDAVFVGCREAVEADSSLSPYAQHISYADAADSDDAAAKAVKMAKEGQVDIIVKGMLNTDNLLRAVLNKETGILPKGAVLTHLTAFEAPGLDRMVVFSDAAVLPYPTPQQRRAQISYAAQLCRSLGIEYPRIALVHCSEKVDAKHFPFTEDYVACREEGKAGAFGPCIIDGPLDVKTTLSPEALKDKGLDSPLQGMADVLIFPDIEAGNAFYKTLSLFCHTRNAGVLAGASVPVVVPSRGDSPMGKFYSIVLAAAMEPLLTYYNKQ